MFRLIILAVLSVFIGSNTYIARMLARWMGLNAPWTVVWYVGFGLLAASFFLSMLLPAHSAIRRAVYLLGGWFMAVYLLLLIIVPLLHLLLRGRNGPMTVAVLLIAAVLYAALGTWNAGVIRTTRYTVESSKGQPMKIALISDLHIGELIGAEKVREMVEAINAIDADIVLMAGDLFDVAGPKAVQDLEAVGTELRAIRSRKGVYAIFGNHDAGMNHQEAYAAQLMESWGMTVLRDETVRLEGVTIVGRRDKHMARQEIFELMEGVDPTDFIIMLDHQPYELTEANADGVDLLVCGHTHGGQVFPANLVTGRMFKLDYGILREGDFTAIVSSGAGTWGPRMRTATVSEVVEITVK